MKYILLGLLLACIGDVVSQYEGCGEPASLIDRTLGRGHEGSARATFYDYVVGTYMGYYNVPRDTFIPRTVTPDCQFIADPFPGITNCSQYPGFIDASQLSFAGWVMEFDDYNMETVCVGKEFQWHLWDYINRHVPQEERTPFKDNYNYRIKAPEVLCMAWGVARYYSTGCFDCDMIRVNLTTLEPIPGQVVQATQRCFDFQTVMYPQLAYINGQWKIWEIQKAFDNMKLAGDIGAPIYYDDCLTYMVWPPPQASPVEEWCEDEPATCPFYQEYACDGLN